MSSRYRARLLAAWHILWRSMLTHHVTYYELGSDGIYACSCGRKWTFSDMKEEKKKCHWCPKVLPLEQMSATVRNPDVFYCRECYQKGLDIENEAMYGVYRDGRRD